MDYSKLRGLIYEKYGSCSAFAKAVGMSRQTVCQKLSCKSEISLKDINLFQATLGIADDEITDYFFVRKVSKC